MSNLITDCRKRMIGSEYPRKENEKLSWDNITGDSQILPGGFGGADEIKFENGIAKRLRLILPNDSQPYSYLEHCLEVEKIENGQLVRTFRTIRCPKTSNNPNAHCPLCDGQQVRRRVRHACNVWDYDQQKVQKLNAGESVFKPIATARKMGVNILDTDWGVIKTGEGRNDTEYTATNLGPAQVAIPADVQLFDIECEFAPHTVEDMKAIVESAGGDWDKLLVPPQLVYPTLQEALSHVMPNGKYKDQTMQQIWDTDKSPRGMINFLATKSDRVSEEKAAAQVIMVRLGGADIPGVPTVDGGVAQTQPVQQPAQNTQPVQPAQNTQPVQPVQNTQPAVQPVSGGRQEILNKINQFFAEKEKFVKGGFSVIIDTMKKCGNGKTNIVEFTDAELDTLLKECEQS